MAHTIRGRSFIALLLLIGVKCQSAQYYIDYSVGDDSNNGTSTLTPWKHCPKDSRATGNASTCVLAAGDFVYFKRGITYSFTGSSFQGINFTTSGSLIVSNNFGSISSSGILTDISVNFNTSNVLSGDLIYIYNNTTSGEHLGSLGVWTITNVSPTTLSVSGFNEQPDSSGLLSYLVTRPISITSTSSWGTGSAVLDGAGEVDGIFRPDSYFHFSYLDIRNMKDEDATGCTNISEACIWDNNTRYGVFVDHINFSNVFSSFKLPGQYHVFQDCTITNFGYFGVVINDYCLIQNNKTDVGCRSVGNVGSYAVIRYNTFVNNESCDCGEHSNGIGVIFGANGLFYGWIYGNYIENVVQGIYLTRPGTNLGWTIANNVIVGHFANDGSGTGATGIGATTAPECKIYNNLITGTNSNSGWSCALRIGTLDDPTSDQSTNVSLINNLILNPGTRQVGLITMADHSTNGFISNGNMWYEVNKIGALNAFSTDTLTFTYAQWQAFGFDTANSFYNVDPIFVDAANLNFHLQKSSPAVNSPYSLPVNLPDFDHILRYTGTLWDRGPYQAGRRILVIYGKANFLGKATIR